jgi:hypothetical protein
MQKIITLVLVIFYICSAKAQPSKANYQIDLIIFTHQGSNTSVNEPLFFPYTRDAIQLKKSPANVLIPYAYLPIKNSHLQKEYYALRRKPEYNVLLQASWLQPANNHKTIQIPPTLHGDWEVQGTLAIQQSNYYLLNAKLIFTTRNNNQFILVKKERLNANTIYYLDHPQAGLIVKIHKVI